MVDFNSQLLAVLGEIKGGGSFVYHGSHSFLFPGLKIRNVDEISFPINSSQIRKMIKVAHKAPFGKGSKTLLDTTVRSAWEIDASEIKFTNGDWDKLIKNIIKQVKPNLGIEAYSVSANLYKLLIYEKGDFFLAHQDSEKEKGMFGTLIIGLPSSHTGGDLVVRFDGQEKIIDFSSPANQHRFPFAAFYADCEHEIKPIISGYRVCLVYNLIQNKGNEKIQLQPLGTHVEKLAAILKTGENNPKIPKIILLGHQYTPSNFTMGTLKLNDRAKAETLIQAAEKAGFYVKLGLVTSFQSGELEMDYSKKSSSRYGRRNGYYDEGYSDEELAENGTMGEVHDEYIDIEHWMEEGVPPLRNIEFKKDDLITAITLNEGEPIEKEAEGYTGNAGMDMQYWYHYGAVFLWPRKFQYDMLISLDTPNQLEWIDYYNLHWETLQKADKEIVRKIAEDGLSKENPGDKMNFSPLADWLINLRDEKYLSDKGGPLLTDHFIHIPAEHWIKLFKTYPSAYFENIFIHAAGKGESSVVRHLLIILHKLLTENAQAHKLFLANQTEQIPAYLEVLALSDKKDKAIVKDILQNVLEINKLKAQKSAEWDKKTTDAFTKKLTREYVNEVLMAEILEFGSKTTLAKKIMAVCQEDLARRVKNQPDPPANWSRAVPGNSGQYGKEWTILTDFLKSPTQQVFDYQSIQTKRTEMEYAIKSVTIDIKMETIRKGSPHTLRLIKTQNAYQRELAKWKIDVELLKKAEEW